MVEQSLTGARVDADGPVVLAIDGDLDLGREVTQQRVLAIEQLRRPHRRG